jgi:hypothetical protein
MILNLQAQYDCNCGTVDINSIIKTPSGPGCLINVAATVTATSASCVNNSWGWSMIPTASSGNFYVGYSNNFVVPYSSSVNLGFYVNQSCTSLDGSFLVFDPPTSDVCALVPLPVKYIEIVQDNAHLVWSTASELNNSHFIIQSAKDGLEWSNIGRVEGKSNTSSISKYQFKIIDSEVKYVRLIQVDWDGKESISPIIKWNDLKPNTHNIKTFLVKQGEYFPISTNQLEGDFQLTNIFGKIMYQGNMEGMQHMALSSGHYFISTINSAKSGLTLYARIVVL